MGMDFAARSISSWILCSGRQGEKQDINTRLIWLKKPIPRLNFGAEPASKYIEYGYTQLVSQDHERDWKPSDPPTHHRKDS